MVKLFHGEGWEGKNWAQEWREEEGEEKEEEGEKGEEEKEKEVGKCKPNVGPGYSQEKQTLAGACSGLAFRGQEGLGQMLEERKERGGRNQKEKKNWDEIHSLGAGPCLPVTSFSCVKACPVLGSLPLASGSVLAAYVQMSMCSKARDLGEKPGSPGVCRLCHQNLCVH